jgi:proline iminopeptidase
MKKDHDKGVRITLPETKTAPKTNLFVKILRKNTDCNLTQWDRSVMILIPGGPGGNHTTYADIEDDLLKYTDLVIVDLRGCGLSEKSDIKYCSLDQHIRDIDALCTALNINKPIIHGCSYGAFVALGFAINYPNKLSKLILTSGAASGDFIAKAKKNLANRGTKKQIEMGEIVWAGKFTSAEQFQEYYKTMAPLYFYHKLDSAPITTKSGIPYNVELINIAFKTYLKTFNFKNNLNKVTSPTLIFSGKNDWIVDPSEAEVLHSGIQNSTLIMLEKCGHFPWKDQRKQFFSALESFLQHSLKLENEDDEENEEKDTNSEGFSPYSLLRARL